MSASVLVTCLIAMRRLCRDTVPGDTLHHSREGQHQKQEGAGHLVSSQEAKTVYTQLISPFTQPMVW